MSNEEIGKLVQIGLGFEPIKENKTKDYAIKFAFGLLDGQKRTYDRIKHNKTDSVSVKKRIKMLESLIGTLVRLDGE